MKSPNKKKLCKIEKTEIRLEEEVGIYIEM
jgi:hypothetical protein